MESKTFSAKFKNSWENKINKAQGKKIGSNFIPAHYAGIYTSLFNTNIWYEVIQSQLNGYEFSIVKTIRSSKKTLIAYDSCSRGYSGSPVNWVKANFLILDLTGFHSGISKYTASLILKIGSAAEMIGTKTILVGITPQLSTVITQSELDLSTFDCFHSLQHGIHYALSQQGRRIV